MLQMQNMNNIERQLQLFLKRIEKWASDNGFKCSENETVVMYYCTKGKLHPDPDLFLNESKIKIVEESKFLGVIFDKKTNHSFSYLNA